MTIRAHLLLLAGLAALPVLVFAILISIMLIEQEQRTFERGAIERARAIMSAIDADLRGSISTLKALAASRPLAADDMRGFEESVVRLLATQPNWRNITLALPTGQKVVDLRAEAGTALGTVLDSPSVKRVIETRQPVVSNVYRLSPDSDGLVAVRVPVIRDGEVRYILTALLIPESFTSVIHEQHLPIEWVAGIIDGNGNFVARAPSLPAGRAASATFRAESRRGKEGWFRGLTIEGRDSYTAYQRSAISDWTIGLAVPAEIVQKAARNSVWLIGIGVLVAIATALALSYLIGKRIVDPMRALASLARRVGEERGAIELPRPGVREVDAVASALQQADTAVRERHLVDQREKDAIEAADRTKDEFIATLSHELRNPLAAITSAASILRRNDLNSDAGREARLVIERQTSHMTRMIEDLLDLSRVIAGKTHLKLERFDLAALVTAVVAAWQAEGRTANHVVTVNAKSVWIHADRTRMEQVLANLLDNAIKFTATGHRVHITVAANGDTAQLDVEDDGQGIAPEMLGRVFDPFVQGYQWMSRESGGLGLGLALVKRLVELQQGTVAVVSDGLGKGATFSVRLPRVEAGVEQEVAPPSAKAAPPGRKRVLIIDDNDDARQSLSMLLSFEGHEVHDAANGVRGTELAAQVRPDVALIDIGLPDLSGYEVARRMRAALNGTVALVAVTGYGQPEDQRRAHDAGFDAHLVKPVTLDQLNETFANLRPRASFAESESD